MGRPSDVSPEEFVRAWQTSRTLDDVSKATGLSKKACSVRAAYYRNKKDVPLRRFQRGGSDISWEWLRSLARELEGTT
jgi:hypothetical protein